MTQTRWFNTLKWILIALTIAIYIGYFLIYVRYAVSLFTFPFDYERGEGLELNNAVLFARGEMPYRNIEEYPFYTSIYPPVYHLTLVPFVWLFGPALWYGRAFSFLTTLITALAIGYAVWRDGDLNGRSKWIAIVSGLAFLASNYVYHNGPLVRQHITMVMYEALAIVVLFPIKHVNEPTANAKADRNRIIIGLVLLLLAGYTKQLAYATVIAAFIFLLSKGFWRAVKAGVAFGLVGAGIFIALNISTQGWWWFHIIIANINEFVPGQLERFYQQWHTLHIVLIWVSVAGLIYEAFKRQVSLYSLWMIITIANGALAGKWGAGESYFITSVAAICLCSGIAFTRLIGDSQKRAEWVRAAVLISIPLLYIYQASRVLHTPTQGRLFGTLATILKLPTDVPYYDSQGYTQIGRPINEIDLEQGNKIFEYVKNAKGPVMTEDSAMFSLLAGKEVVSDSSQFLNLSKVKKFDSEPLIQMIYRHEFSVIILKSQFYPKEVLNAIGQAYYSAGGIPFNGFPYYILLPREK